ncbi:MULTISPECIES: CcdB family protein [Escherichia]|uniref:Toxin CcdB n=2 Tax=Escherichia TaxID=561 RepID=A0AAJ3NXI2_ECOLX|nr:MULTISPECIES: CcdB family protein [Escherichia]EFN6913714.1 taxon MazF [Escherichia coli O10]OSL47177.1 toxin-antitoxin system, toxin component, MazF family [Escherichia coli H605]EFB3349647.1 taxon MazF [Escherichia coli]EFH7843491.1 taxon MazF [Escherichia coli]EJH3422988.1 CcdB family protein [Escherichia coli]
MEQYCAYENLGSGRHVYPYLINLQHPVANVLKHAIVAPAIRLDQLPGGKPPVKVCPVVSIAGLDHMVMTHMMTGIPLKELGERIADLSQQRIVLRDAIDFLLNGY